MQTKVNAPDMAFILLEIFIPDN